MLIIIRYFFYALQSFPGCNIRFFSVRTMGRLWMNKIKTCVYPNAYK